jgi:hypothetical protein
MDTTGLATLHPDAVRLTEYLKDLGQKQLQYVILVYDLDDSPLRKKPLEERRIFAKRKLGINEERDYENLDTMKKAIEEYQALNFNLRRTMKDSYLTKIMQLQRAIMIEDDPTRIKQFTSSIDILENKVHEMELALEEEEKIELRGKKSLSFLELYKRNQREHRKFMNV